MRVSVYFVQWLICIAAGLGEITALGSSFHSQRGQNYEQANGHTDTCVEESECPRVVCGYPYGIRGRACIEDDCNVKMCCNTGISTSREACESYSTYSLKRQVFQGTSLSSILHPYLAAIGFVKRISSNMRWSGETWICTGALISEKYVITAAHCVTDPSNGILTTVKIRNKLEEYYYFGVEDMIVHDEYQAPNYYHDIALIKLLGTVKLGPLMPLCISSNTIENYIDKTLTFLGWESPYEYDVEPNTVPQMTWKKVIKTSQCKKEIDDDFHEQLPDKLDKYENFLFCAKNESSDTCHGDSGGPVISMEEDGHVLVGITSFGYDPCGGRPGIYTNVAYYTKWIECIVWPKGQ